MSCSINIIRNPFLNLPVGIKKNIISNLHDKDVINSLFLARKQGWSEVVRDENLWERRAIRQLDKKRRKALYINYGSWKKVCETLSKTGIIYSDGKQEKGEFKNGKLHGPNGVRIYPDGSKEEGRFKNGKLKEGRICWGDGEEWEGQFKNGKLHGTGRISIDNEDECSVVDGVFKHGELEKEYFRDEYFSSEDDEISDQGDME